VNILTIDKLNYRDSYTDIELNIDHIEIPYKSFICLTGEEQSGKTPLLEVMAGVRKEDRGLIQKAFKSHWRYGAPLRYVPDEILLEENITAKQYLDFCRHRSKNYYVEAENIFCDKIFKIDRREKLLSMTYQENKLVALIGALCAKPRLLLLDEPGNYLEEEMLKNLYKVLIGLPKTGTSVVVATNSYKELERYCSHYIFLKEGRVYSQGKAIRENQLWKVVTLINPKSLAGEEQIGEKLYQKDGKYIYIYKGKGKQNLSRIINEFQCEDFCVENISFEEWIQNDLSRWKQI
jgi:ABC-type multidrug transport system, ATPase component